MTTTKTLTKSDLSQFTGSEQWYRHGLVRDVLFTDGAKYVADAGGAYWLIDKIAFARRRRRHPRRRRDLRRRHAGPRDNAPATRRGSSENRSAARVATPSSWNGQVFVKTRSADRPGSGWDRRGRGSPRTHAASSDR
jgi:hypothetical protein